MPFLLFDEKMGTRAVKSVPLTAFPWAINGIGQVVYIDCKDDLLAARMPVPSPLVPYSKPISMDRRRKCQSLLAHLALTQRSYTSGAVTKVSLGVLDYILQCLKTNKLIRKEMEFCMDRYMYSKAGFGRLGQPEDKPKGDGELYRRCVTALTQGELPTILAIHYSTRSRRSGGLARRHRQDDSRAAQLPRSPIVIELELDQIHQYSEKQNQEGKDMRKPMIAALFALAMLATDP